MSYLGRKGAVAPLTSADIPVGIVEGTDIAFLENASGTQNLGGTYSTERMYLNDSYTLTGDVNITNHLALGTIADSDVVITDDGSTRTITGSGTLESGKLVNDPTTSLTGMTGELGSAVTGSPALNLSNATFPEGHIIQTRSVQTALAWTVTDATARTDILSLSVTHLQTNPTVLVMVSGLFGVMYNSPNGAVVSDDQGIYRIYDDTNDVELANNRTVINHGYANANRQTVLNAGISSYKQVTVSAGSTIDYKFQAWPTSTGYAKVTINGFGSATSYGTTTMTVFELKS